MVGAPDVSARLIYKVDWAVFRLAALTIHTYSSTFIYTQKLAQSILITGAFVDVLVAGVLSYYLNKARTGIKS